MNGRVYDYNLGRFLSVDPFIQSPTNTQSMNPYSYIMNNPLAGTDPSGYSACGDMLSKRRCEPMTFDKVMAGTSRSTMAGGKLDHGNVTRFIAKDNGNKSTAAASAVAQKSSSDVTQIGSQVSVAGADDFGQTPMLKGADSSFGNIKNGTETACVPMCLAIPLVSGETLATAAVLLGLSTAVAVENASEADSIVDEQVEPIAGMRTPTPPGDPDDNDRKVKNGPEFENLKDHAHRHGLSGQTTNQYYNAAVRHTQIGHRFKVRHNGTTKYNYVTRTGKDSFTFTSGSTSGKRVYTHMYNVNSQYLRNKGIKLPSGF